jgi:NAD(P)-dependent dehydrogenase (short-subunit alcohol dehydrogenase family)
LFSLNGKIAVVTGGASGIGLAISTLFARQGARVVVLDLDGEAARAAAAAIVTAGGSAESAACDVGEAGSVRATFDGILRRSQRLDILINNAGVAHVGNIEGTPEAEFDRL